MQTADQTANQTADQTANQTAMQTAIQKSSVRWILESKRIISDDLKYLMILLDEQHLKEYIKKYIVKHRTKVLITCVLNNVDMRKICGGRVFSNYSKQYNFRYEDLSGLTFQQFKYLKTLFADNRSMHKIIYSNEILNDYDKKLSGEYFALIYLFSPVYFPKIDISIFNIKDVLLHCSGEVLENNFLMMCGRIDTSIFAEDFKFTINFLISSLDDLKKLKFFHTIILLSHYQIIGAITREEINEFDKLIRFVYNTCSKEFIKEFEYIIKQHYTNIDVHLFFILYNIDNNDRYLDFLYESFDSKESKESKDSKEILLLHNLCEELDGFDVFDEDESMINKIKKFLESNGIDISVLSNNTLLSNDNMLSSSVQNSEPLEEIKEKMESTILNALMVENMTLRGIQFTSILKRFQSEFTFNGLVRNSGNFEFSDLKYVITNWSIIFGDDLHPHITEIVNNLIELDNIKYIYWIREIFKSMNIVLPTLYVIPVNITDFSNDDINLLFR